MWSLLGLPAPYSRSRCARRGLGVRGQCVGSGFRCAGAVGATSGILALEVRAVCVGSGFGVQDADGVVLGWLGPWGFGGVRDAVGATTQRPARRARGVGAGLTLRSLHGCCSPKQCANGTASTLTPPRAAATASGSPSPNPKPRTLNPGANHAGRALLPGPQGHPPAGVAQVRRLLHVGPVGLRAQGARVVGFGI